VHYSPFIFARSGVRAAAPVISRLKRMSQEGVVVRSSRRRRLSRSIAVVGVVALAALVVPACSNDSSSGSSGPALTTIFVQKFRYHGMPSTMSSGLHEFLFQNKESFPITHEMIPVALPSGKTAEDITAEAKAKGPDSEDEWLHIGGDFGAVDTGAGIVELVYLPAGSYAVACWQTGRPNGSQNGPPHAAIGMVHGFTVT
jgi:hypothetical protein